MSYDTIARDKAAIAISLLKERYIIYCRFYRSNSQCRQYQLDSGYIPNLLVSNLIYSSKSIVLHTGIQFWSLYGFRFLTIYSCVSYMPVKLGDIC